MANAATKRTNRKRKGQNKPDPRFVALAQLLARDLARKHLEQDSRENELSPSRPVAYDSDSQPGDES